MGWLSGGDTRLTATARRLVLTAGEGGVDLYYRDEDSGGYYRCRSEVADPFALAGALAGAVDKFDPDKGIKFETYVSKRIRGAVIDLARRQDWVPRSVRRKARDIDQASSELFAELGRYPTDQEMADRLGVTPDQYQEDLANSSMCNVLSLDALFEDREQSGEIGRAHV